MSVINPDTITDKEIRSWGTCEPQARHADGRAAMRPERASWTEGHCYERADGSRYVVRCSVSRWAGTYSMSPWSIQEV